MSIDINARLKTLDITLPDAPAPAANYLPYIINGNMIYISGQISKDETGLIIGKLGDNFTTEKGNAAARVCGLNLIAQLRTAVDGDLNRVEAVIRLGGFVNSTPNFTEHPQVINGASDLMVEIFGDKGRHARAAVGCSSLPLGVAVEVEGVFKIA